MRFDYVTAGDVLSLQAKAEDVFIGRIYEVPQQHMAGIWEGSDLLAAFGTSSRWPGVAELWGVVSQSLPIQPVLFTRRCAWLVDKHAKEFGLRRISAWVEADNAKCTRFARLCGFRAEYLDAGAGPNGEDLALYVRRWQWQG